MMNDILRENPPMEDYAAVEAVCEGVPVYSFSNLIYVYGQSPDLYPSAGLQENNSNPISKIKLKKSWEIKNNFIGFCHEMTPRTRKNDWQPFLPIHLIDGDPETIWASFECFAPDAVKEWIRIDLPMEGTISEIILTCKQRFMNRDRGRQYKTQWNFGNSLPKDLTVELSRDAWHWLDVFHCEDLSTHTEESGAVKVTLREPVLAKQALISGRDFSKIGYEGYMFSINGVELRNPEGINLALVSKGAGVTVSSTSDIHNSDRYSANSLWGPLQYDVGNKWVKTGSDSGSALWCFTEHENGVLAVDEDFDQAVTETVRNGIRHKLVLDFKGNWIYQNPPGKTDWTRARYAELNDSYLCGVDLVDATPEMFEGYLRYVAYMVEHFKNRVEYFDVGNEWPFWVDSVDWYKNTIFEPTYDVIKRVAPEAKVGLCGTPGFLTKDILACLKAGVMARNGKLILPGRALLLAKELDADTLTVSMKANSDSAIGLVLGCKSKIDFITALYDPAAGELYFIECAREALLGVSVGLQNDNDDMVYFDMDDLLKLGRKNIAAAKGFGEKTELKAVLSENKIVVTVSGGNQTVSSEYAPESGSIRGSAGILRFSGEADAIIEDFSVTGRDGQTLPAYQFKGGENLAEHWRIHYDHWGDPNKTPAAQRLGAISWHAINSPTAEYFRSVKRFKKDCEKLGFSGQFFCDEIYAGSGYPPGPVAGNPFRQSDMQEAKYNTRCMVGYSSLNIESGPCHVHFTGFPHPQAVCRTTVPSQVVAPCQPKPSYYAIRNISTIMDDFYEAEFPVLINDDNDIMYFTLENSDKTERMIAAFLQTELADCVTEKKIDIQLPGMSIRSAAAIDSFNGTEQELDLRISNGNTLLNGIHIKDYPVFIKLHR